MKQSDDFVENESGWSLGGDGEEFITVADNVTIHGVVTVQPCAGNCGEEG